MTYSALGSDSSRSVLTLTTKGKHGDWANAVDKNEGGNKRFVNGPWKAGYPLGTYGVDRKTKSVWAVIDYTGDFAVARSSE